MQQELDRRRSLVGADQHRGVIGVVLKVTAWRCSPPAPEKASMVVRLWVPASQVLRARNWNLARAGVAFTASSVAKSVGVSTPFRGIRIRFSFGGASWRPY